MQNTQLVQESQQLLLNKKNQYAKEVSDSTWKLSSDKDGIKFYTKKESTNGLTMTKTEGIIKKPVSEVLKFYSNFENGKIVGEGCLEASVIETLPDGSFTFYLNMKGMFGVDGRDFVGINQNYTEGDSTIIIRADFQPTNAPAIPKGVTRGEVTLWGFTITKVDETSTNLLVVSSFDIKGSIPDFIKSKLADKDLQRFKNVKKYIEEL